MRSGWPHSGDGQGEPPADQGHVPFGPEVSWPNGFPEMDYRNADHRYADPRSAQLPAASQGAHPYAGFNGAGYGDDGYRDPGYQGPAEQDAGIAGTRTVRGFVEPGQGQHGYPLSSPTPADYGQAGYGQSGYPQSGYPQSGYPQPGYEQPGNGQGGYAGSTYAGSGEIEMAYPPSAADPRHRAGADLYSQPWDYDQPLRYEGEDDAYPSAGRHGRDNTRPADDGAVRYQPPVYDADAYNGSDYSMPGINGPGYDLSGIIGTSDFEAIGYDEPSYGRLSYDDPRYDDPRYDDRRYADTSGYPGSFDETRLDNRWQQPGGDVRREASSAGYGNDAFDGGGRTRSELPSGDSSARSARTRETRYDLQALTEPADHTRFDVPVFDETRLDNLRALTPGGGMRAAAGPAVLAPPSRTPRSWAEDTSLDQFANLDLTDEPVPAAFTRTLDRPQQDDDTAARRAVGRRRGRSGDRRQWMALGAIAVVMAGGLAGVVMKYVFAGPSGPAHQVVAPQSVDGYTRSANLEKQMQVDTEAQQVAKASSGQASGVVPAVYQQGSLGGTSGSSAQIFMFVGGKLAGADPGASVANFEHSYKGAQAVSPGSLGGQAACTTIEQNGQSSSMCVWFDNDTFGTLVSPTMTTAKLASTMDTVRPGLELYAK